jgi:hypothetical protein
MIGFIAQYSLLFDHRSHPKKESFFAGKRIAKRFGKLATAAVLTCECAPPDAPEFKSRNCKEPCL